MSFSIFNDFEDPARDKENCILSLDKSTKRYNDSSGVKRPVESKRVRKAQRKGYHRGYNPDILNYKGRETTFEEYRAMIYLSRGIYAKSLPLTLRSRSPAPSTKTKRQKLEIPKMSPIERVSPDSLEGELRRQESDGPEQVQPLFMSNASPLAAPASPTIHTREALSSVEAMFRDDTAEVSATIKRASEKIDVPKPSKQEQAFSIFCDYDEDSKAEPHTKPQLKPEPPSAKTSAAKMPRIRDENKPPIPSRIPPTHPVSKNKGLTTIHETSNESIFSLSSPSTSSPRPSRTLGAITNPFDEKARSTYLKSQLRSCNYIPFHNLTGQACDFTVEGLVNGEETMVDLEDISLNIDEYLGAINDMERFKAIDLDSMDNDKKMELAVSSPANLWPLHISNKITTFLREAQLATDDLVLVEQACEFRTLSAFLISYPKYSNGTLQDVIDVGRSKSLNEVLCAFYAIEMLRLLEKIHSCHVIHSRIIPQNFILMKGSGSTESPGPWNKERTAGWSDRGLALTGFYDAIDMHMYKGTTVQFTCENKRVLVPCLEQQDSRPFTYQLDTYAFCDILHQLIHQGEKINPKRSQKGQKTHWMPQRRIPKSFHERLWNGIFKTFLNVKGGQNPALNVVREMLEQFLSTGERSEHLPNLFLRLGSDIHEHKK
ncbi:hypothetical protein AAMO2058_000595000 [Amorphochlora amoebiformis]|eukprot:1337690-Amorphochlora_amoeboformis.AAC.2